VKAQAIEIVFRLGLRSPFGLGSRGYMAKDVNTDDLTPPYTAQVGIDKTGILTLTLELKTLIPRAI